MAPSSTRAGSAAVLAAFLVLVALAASVGAAFQPGPWYEALRKPPLTPPDAVFAPVWSALYLAMAVAAWLVWRERGPDRALVLWAVQLAANALWSLLFFGLHVPGLALLEIALLLGLLAATTRAFFRIRPLAGALLLPYLAWVAFASYLNAGLWLLNR